MDTQAIALIITAVVIVLIVGLIVMKRRGRSEEQQAFDEQLKQVRKRQEDEKKALAAQHDSELKPFKDEAGKAKREYDDRVKTASKALKDAEKQYSSIVKSAEKGLRAAESIGTQQIASIKGKEGRVSFTGTTLTFGHATHDLKADLEVSVDAVGNRFQSTRTSLTRVAVGGATLGVGGAILGASAKKGKIHDDRELYLNIGGEDFAYCLTLDPNSGQQARSFAAKLLASARQADKLRAERAQQTAIAQANLETAKKATSGVEQAQQVLDAESQDSTNRDAAQQRFDAEQQSRDVVRSELEAKHTQELRSLAKAAVSQGLTIPKKLRQLLES